MPSLEPHTHRAECPGYAAHLLTHKLAALLESLIDGGHNEVFEHVLIVRIDDFRGSMVMDFMSPCPVNVAVTIPPPTLASTVSCARFSCICIICDCICLACFIMLLSFNV